MKGSISWEDIRRELPEDIQNRLNEKRSKRLELAIVLYDGSFDSIGEFTEEEAKEFIEKNKECDFVTREIKE
jgi:putative sterol carrier protein